MTIDKRNLRVYITLICGAIFIIALYILIYLSQINNDYLYFSKAKVDVNLGESFSLEDLGLNSSVDFEKLEIECDNAIYTNGNITFSKAGNTKVYAKSKKLKATLQVEVSFDSINEYFDIYANVNESKISLNNTSIVELYLPSENATLAFNDGYVSSFILGVECLKQNDNFSIVCGDNLICQEGKIIAKSLGDSRVYLEFETFGKSFEFEVVVKEIPVVDITSNHMFDTIYVSKNEIFSISVNIMPSYATDKMLNVSIEGNFVVANGDSFIGLDYGESFITFTKDNAKLIVKVVVCDVPDKMLVNVTSPFVYGATGRATVNFYKDGGLIDSDYKVECYVDGVVVSSEGLIENFEIKHNTFSLDIITEKTFVIKIVSYKNLTLTFDISVNN